MSKSVCNHPHGTCAVCWEKMRDLSAALTAAQERERAMREARCRVLLLIDDENKLECESPKCGHGEVCRPCMDLIEIRMLLTHPGLIRLLDSAPKGE